MQTGRGKSLSDRIPNQGVEPQASFAKAVDAPSAVENRVEREHLFRLLQALITAIAVLLLLAGLSRAHGESYNFRSFQQPEGLENLNIHCMVQDHSGLIWLCTENGLYSFDGARVSRVATYEGRDIPYITAVNEDSSHRLWVSGYHELMYRDSFGMHRLGLPRYGTQKNAITAIASLSADRDQVFFLADQVLYRVFSRDNGATWQQTPVFTARQIAGHPELKTLDSLFAIDNPTASKGRLWMSCANKLCSVSPEDGSVQVWGAAEGVPSDTWDVIMRDHLGRLWGRGVKHLVCLPKGASHFLPEEGSLSASALTLRAPALAEDPQGRILTNVNNGMARREGDDWRVFGPQNDLPADLVANFLFDRGGSFWFSADGHGLQHWLGYDNWESWKARNGLSVGALWGLDQDRQGTMWVATELDVELLPSLSDRWRPLALPQAMRQAQALLVDSRGHIWIGQATGAVLDYDPATRSTRTVTHLKEIYNFFQDPTGSIWICSTKQLYRLDASDGYTQLQTTTHGHPFPNSGLLEVRAAPNGDLYFMGEQGLFRLRANSDEGFAPVKLPAGISLPYNSPLAIGKDGTLWLQGESAPVVHFRIHDTANGPTAELLERIAMPTIASPSVYQLSIDHRGWLWVGTDRGEDVFNGHQWVGLTTEDGLVWDDTDSDSFHESPDGSVWIGTSGGLAHIRHPEEIFHQEPLAIRVFDARLGSEAIRTSGGSKVPWAKRGALTMALGVSDPGRASLVHYRYRLEGSDNDWQETDEPLVRYAGLPPGRYKLAVVAIDARRHQESAPVYINFRLLPPWWRTAWFLCGLAVTIAALVGLASWWRVSALIAQQQRLEELVRERTYQLELEKKELIEARMALVEQASRDGLTGLLNRSAIFDILSNEIQYASEKNTSLAIVLADLDHFKRINDTYGHQIGDAVLRECARRFRQATRPTDYVGRYGGEELLLILPGLSQDNSLERLENLRATIAHELFDCEGVGLPVTCSFGVAWLDEQSRGIKPLIALADQALYAAKTRGRNRVETISSASSGLFFPDGSGPLVTV
jgi:diguanylate cyclase (GGDEF)-like protein